MKRLSHTLRTRLIGAGLGSVLSALLLLAGLIGFTTPAAAEELLVKLVAGLTADQQADVIARNGGNEVSQITALRLHVIEVPPAELDAAIASYEADAEVERVELNATRKADSEPVGGWDPLYIDQWFLPQIDWDLPTLMPSGNAVVALLDTGVDATHPDLAGKVLAGTSILDGGSGTTDPSGHGTQMAGIIAAVTNNGEGGAGVAYAGVDVLPVTVLGADATGQDSDVIAGVMWAADNGADVILMAFSNPTKSGSLQDALDYAWGKGVVLVAATGNADSADPTFPAGHRGVMGISATTEVDSLAPGSNHGLATFLGAPGIDILTTGAGNSYVRVNGTSTSAAIVAGVAGFMKAADPGLSNGVIVGRLGRTADPAGTQYETGNGRVNMARALADTGTEPVQPAGVEGGGGPFEGPYEAAARNISVTIVGSGSVTISASTGTVSFQAVGANACIGTGNNSASVTISSSCASLSSSNNTATVTISASALPPSSFVGWTGGTSGFASCTGTNSCSRVLTGGQNDVTATFAAPTDETPPVITPIVSGIQGNNSWYISNVTVSWTVVDDESGISSSTGCGNTTINTDTTGITLTCSATSEGGSSTESITIKRDATAPTVTVTPARGPDVNGWYNAPVGFTTAGSDATSGMASCTTDQTYSGPDGTGLTVTGSCTDEAGNVGNGASAIFKYDATAPTVAVTPARAPDVNGWYTAPVDFTTTGTDGTSGVASCTTDQTYSGPDGTGLTVTGSCTDGAGNVGNGASAVFKYDATPPTLTWNGGPENDGIYYFGAVPSEPTCTAADATSGPSGCTITGYSTVVGEHTMNATASDFAGNTYQETRAYEVLAWTLDGFYRPVDMTPNLWNTVKNGSTVPLKFRIFAGDDELTNVTAVKSFTATRVPCENGSAEDPVDFVTTGNTSLRYDLVEGQFIQNWKTPKGANTCYRVTMTTQDGSTLIANFKLK